MATLSDDEWEYEYDDNETQDFFIPLDLSNVPGAQTPMVSQGRPGHPTLLKSRLRALNAAQGQPTEFATGTAIEGDEPATMGQVQITGLHTPNPLVMYNGQLLSCQWTSTIGTDMFFMRPDAGVGHPLRSLPAVDLISLSSAKLVAKVGRLRPRDDVINHIGDDASSAEQETSRTEAVGDEHTSTTTAVQSTSRDEGSSSAETQQPGPTSFLAKLNQAKLKRGETTRLVVSKTTDGTRLVSESVQEDAAVANADSSETLDDTVMLGT